VICYPALLLFHFVMLLSSMMFTAVPRAVRLGDAVF